MTAFTLSEAALQDFFEITDGLRAFSESASEQLELDFYAEFELLAKFPAKGKTKPHITKLPCLFMPLRDYFVVYNRSDVGIEIVMLIHASRNVKRALRERFA